MSPSVTTKKPTLPGTHQILRTPYADLAIWSLMPTSILIPRIPTILFIHGNSYSSAVFYKFFNSSLAKTHQLVTFDLPGHGASSNAGVEDNKDALPAEQAYNQTAWAHAAVTVLDALKIKQVVVFGWSLGGHIAMEMMQLLPPSRLRGVMISGSPATPVGELQTGITVDLDAIAALKNEITVEETEGFARAGAGAAFEEWMVGDVERAHGLARWHMQKHWRGVTDQKTIVERNEEVLLGVVHGGADPFISGEYVVNGPKYGRLWRGKVLMYDGCGHAPFLEKEEEFAELLEEFCKDAVA